MKGKLKKTGFIILSLLILFVCNSCKTLDIYQSTVDVFQSKYLSSYSVKKIALLPMEPDTRDSAGTYYATDYFLDMLLDYCSNVEFAEVNDLREYDYSFLPDAIADIEEYKILDVKNFLKTDIGCVLKKWNCDAVLIGGIDSTNRAVGSMISFDNTKLLHGRKTSCYFHYYLVSLKDGRVLWKAKVTGRYLYNMNTGTTRVDLATGTQCYYPPVDHAICIGLEKMAKELPKKIFN